MCILSDGKDQVGEERLVGAKDVLEKLLDSGLGSKLYVAQSHAGWPRPLGFVCRLFPGAMALLRILTLPRVLVRFSPVPDFRNSLYTIPVSTSVLSPASWVSRSTALSA